MAAKDKFARFPSTTTGPASDSFTIVPSDTVDFDWMARTIYVGTGGDVTAVMLSGKVQLFKNVPSGGLLPIRVSRINATGTTATDMVGLQ